MAWPNDPRTAYVAGFPLAIKADDLNAIQEVITQIINGTIELTGLYLSDAGGGAIRPSPPKAGGVDVTSLITAATAPTPLPMIGYGRVGVGSVTRGWCVLTGAGVMLRGWNVRSCNRTPMGSAQGDYTVVFHASPVNPNAACVYGSIIGNGIPATWDVVPGSSLGFQSVRVGVYDLAGTRTDRAVCIGFYGE